MSNRAEYKNIHSTISGDQLLKEIIVSEVKHGRRGSNGDLFTQIAETHNRTNTIFPKESGASINVWIALVSPFWTEVPEKMRILEIMICVR